MLRTLIFIFLLLVPLQLQAQVIVNLANSVVKIKNSGKCLGSAFVINADEDNYYLLTAGHNIQCGDSFVYKECSSCKAKPVDLTKLKIDVFLYHNGTGIEYKDVGEVLAYSFDRRIDKKLDDLGLIKLPKESVAEYGKPLHVLKLAQREKDIDVGRLIWTCGHANGGWPTLYRGTVVKNTTAEEAEEANDGTCADNPDAVMFYPAASPGRSGSPLMNYNGQRVIGVVTYTVAYSKANGSMGTATKSGAVPYWKIREFLDNYYETLRKV